MDPYLGEIRIFAGNFAPNGWALCNGDLLSIVQNPALFSILGTHYGGDARTTFALPNFKGKAPLNQGEGPGLSRREIGDKGGAPSITLTQQEIPSHTHEPNSQSTAGVAQPTGAIWAKTTGLRGQQIYGPNPDTPMSPTAIQVAGNSQSHNNMQPYLGLNYIIALNGVFPSRG
jgi:microcystin-dependent protein